MTITPIIPGRLYMVRTETFCRSVLAESSQAAMLKVWNTAFTSIFK